MKTSQSNSKISDLINVKVGLEVETHRINKDGELSHNDYPHGC